MPPAVDRAATFPLGAAVGLVELERDPHPTLARLRATEPVSWLPVFDGWLVTSHALASKVMRDDMTYTVDDPRFSTATVVGPSMLSLDGKEHTRHRSPFVAPFLRAAVATSFADVVDREAERLLDAIRDDGRADLRATLAAPLAVATMASALGLAAPPEDVLRWYEAIVADVTAVTSGAASSGRGRQALAELGRAVDAAAGHAGTLVAEAWTALDRDEVVANVAVLLFGGVETTEATIATALAHLLERPDALARVRADPALAAAAVEESLRLEPAASVVDRYATRDVELGGAQIGAGELVRVSLTGANRDPTVFSEPNRYDLDRRDGGRHVTFAHGPHTCLGLHLARLEAVTAVGRAVATLRGIRPDLRRPPVVRGLVFRKPASVHAEWDA